MKTTSRPTSLAATVRLLDDYRATPLREFPRLAHLAGVARVFVKMENERPLGNFKYLGGMVAGLRALAGAGTGNALPPRLICASDGNHGLAVAAAARRANAYASIYLPDSVSDARAARIRAHGGEVIRIAGTYDDAVDAAAAAAARGAGLLIPDTSASMNDPVVRDVMAGYEVLTEELAAQFSALNTRPSHVFVQAGVGGLAAALAQGLATDGANTLLTVEPENAACVAAALRAGHPVRVPGALETSAEMLSCGIASAPAVATLLRHHARAIIVGERELENAVVAFAPDTTTTPSGAAGLAGLLHVAGNQERRARHALAADSVVLLIVTEGAVPSMDLGA